MISKLLKSLNDKHFVISQLLKTFNDKKLRDQSAIKVTQCQNTLWSISQLFLGLGAKGRKSDRRKSLLRNDIKIESYEVLPFIELLIVAVGRKWCSLEIVRRHDVFWTATGRLPWELPAVGRLVTIRCCLPHDCSQYEYKVCSCLPQINKEHSGPSWTNVAVSYYKR